MRRMHMRAVLIATAFLLTAARSSEPPPSAAQEAWMHLLRGEPEKAARRAEDALAAGTDPARAALCLVEAFHRLGRGKEALQLLEERRTPRRSFIRHRVATGDGPLAVDPAHPFVWAPFVLIGDAR